MRWHAPHPANPKLPACGTVGEDGAPTYRVAKLLTVTCLRCKKALAKREAQQRQEHEPSPMEPWQAGLM